MVVATLLRQVPTTNANAKKLKDNEKCICHRICHITTAAAATTGTARPQEKTEKKQTETEVGD